MQLQKVRVNKSTPAAGFAFLELLFHSVVRDVRVQNGNANLGILLSILQTLVLLAIFAFVIVGLGLRTFAIRGDFIVYILTGIMLFLMHTRAVSSIMNSSSATAPMLLHSPMNTLLLISGAALSGLYTQLLAFVIILTVVHIVRGGLEFYDPAAMLLPFFMAWASGIGVGMLFLGLRPFAPKFIPMLSMLYRRAQMVTSGKMMPANYMSAGMVEWFDWNPLFHAIDQIRGAAFVNYFPRNSNIGYPIKFTIVAICIALMIDFWLRKNMSSSWGKRSIL